MPNSPAFLVDLVTGERLAFQFAPNDLKGDRTTGWVSAKVPGMSHPRCQYVSGEERTLQFTVEFFQIQDIEARVRWLQSLTYPEYEQGFLSAPPHLVELVFIPIHGPLIQLIIGLCMEVYQLIRIQL